MTVRLFKHYCYTDISVVEYYINDSGHLNYELHYCINEENKKCVDGHCGCVYDSDCAANQDNVKGKCCSPSGSLKKGSADCPDYDYLCKWPKCAYNSDCVDNACCVASSATDNGGTPPSGPNPGRCVSRGIFADNTTYLCDPPNGWSTEEKFTETGAKTQNIFEFLFSFFPKIY